jgi:pimeloyl-ACP methyl ester carboxylesterase
MPEVEARGIRFHVQRIRPPAGGGAEPPVVVLLHGLVMDNLSSVYYTLAGPLARAGAEVLMYDLRGHGRTERPPTGYTVPDAVDDFAAVVDALDVRRPVYVVGNSFGGVVALRAAMARPDLIAGIAVIETHTVGGPDGDWNEYMSNTLTVVALGLAHDGLAGQLELLGDRKLARAAATADALLNRTTLIDDLATATPMRPVELAAVHRPVLAIYGEHSDLADASKELARALPNCRHHLVPGQGHTVLREATPIVRDLVLAWLADHAGLQCGLPLVEVGEAR